MKDLNFSKNTCPLAETLADPRPVIGQLGYTERVLGRMCSMACEEIGDTLPGHERFFALETRQENPAWREISEARAIEITLSAKECLTDRYMGICATKGCIDREPITELITESQKQMQEAK